VLSFHKNVFTVCGICWELLRTIWARSVVEDLCLFVRS
jgi:hypothetical protein